MQQMFFISQSKLTPKIQSTVLDQQTISLQGKTYLQLSDKPRGKVIDRKLSSLQHDCQIIIYR